MLEILLHICCGPCAIMPVIRLKEMGYTPLLWFRNPNIHPVSEYLRRRDAALECAAKLDVPLIFDDEWDLSKWLIRQLPIEKSPLRCENCVDERIQAAALKARQLGLQYFSTSLLYSKFQPHEHMAEAGEEIARKALLKFVYRDFRQDWQEGIALAKRWALYRQPYCGCVFSEAERYAKKMARLQKAQEKK